MSVLKLIELTNNEWAVQYKRRRRIGKGIVKATMLVNLFIKIYEIPNDTEIRIIGFKRGIVLTVKEWKEHHDKLY